MIYNITIEETVVKTIEIEAENEEQAIDKAIEDYNNGKIDLSSEEVQFKQLSTDCVDWIEF